ncbi:hypothetical protein MUK42_35976, partial [Musa troglodytarum]
GTWFPSPCRHGREQQPEIKVQIHSPLTTPQGHRRAALVTGTGDGPLYSMQFKHQGVPSRTANCRSGVIRQPPHYYSTDSSLCTATEGEKGMKAAVGIPLACTLRSGTHVTPFIRRYNSEDYWKPLIAIAVSADCRRLRRPLLPSRAASPSQSFPCSSLPLSPLHPPPALRG